MTITIRKIETRDFEALHALFKEFATFQKMPDKVRNTPKQMLVEGEYLTGFVAEDDDSGKLAGYATYFFAYYTWTGKSMYLEDLYVSPRYRRQGLGKALIYKVIELAKNKKCKKLKWQVSDWNTNAQEFYKSLGAEIDDIESNCDLWLD